MLTRYVACRECHGAGGVTKFLRWGLSVFVVCRQCKGRAKAREIVGNSRKRK